MMPIRESEPRILIVEENEYHGLLMGRQILQRVEGSQVMIARGADEALRLARIKNFDLAVVDFVLSDCDGLSLLHSLHQLDPHLAIIVVAEQITERLTREVFRQGCDELLVKDSSYYAVVPRMVAGLWHKKQQVCHQRSRPERLRIDRADAVERLRRGMDSEVRECVEEIFKATDHILNLSGMEDNDLTEKVQEIKESAMTIRHSLERNTRHIFSGVEREDWTTVSGDKSAGYAVKSGN